MSLSRIVRISGLVLTFVFATAAHADLFADDAARQAIIQLRTQVDTLQKTVDTKLQTKADGTSVLELSNQNAQIQQQLDALRGKVEQIANDLSVFQKNQSDQMATFDARLRKLEPQTVTIDGAQATVSPEEEQAYNAALATFKGGDYKSANQAFAAFLKQYPASPYAPSAQYWIGNGWFAQGDYKQAIAAQQSLVKKYPNNPKAADALLNIASSYIQLNDRWAAKKHLNELIKQFPNAAAAATAKQRLTELK